MGFDFVRVVATQSHFRRSDHAADEAPVSQRLGETEYYTYFRMRSSASMLSLTSSGKISWLRQSLYANFQL
jgi:hypothetical protein